MKRKKKQAPKARVAIWTPWPMALPNPGEVINARDRIIMTADRHKVGLPLPSDRATQLDYTRSEACMTAIDLGFSHILMMDADHKHGPDDLVERLLAHDKDVVGSLNYARGDGRACMIPRYPDDNPDDWGSDFGLVECSAIGTGTLMIRLAAIADWPQPWFYYPYDALSVLDRDNWPGEDGGFCLNCQKHGVTMWCDTDLNSPHATTKWI